jgi:hypothetical protein
MELEAMMSDDFTIDDFFTTMREDLPKILTRPKVAEISGGALSVKTLQNLDSMGTGITPRFRMGKKVVYPRDAVIKFLRMRSQVF